MFAKRSDGGYRPVLDGIERKTLDEAQVGDSWCIPGGVEHGANILEDSVALEVFSPVRDDCLPGRA